MSGIMSTTTVVLTFLLSFMVSHVDSFASTDTITWGGDNSRTGYQINHNMDPSIVGSSQFGQLFKTVFPGAYGGVPEQMFSQPLVYTPSDGIQYVYVATTQNNLYKVNAKTGAIVLSRNLHIPFLTADLDGCVDINPHVGVTATGVIDPATDTLYLTSKTYIDQTQINVAQGRPAGRYYFHAIDVNDLSERAGFPKDLEGIVARNNPVRSFGGGIHHQRPALLHSGQYIYAGFASHCVQWNFTGWIMGWDKTTGAIVERYATEGAGVDAQTKGAGVWMSGGGLASDDAGSMFFATGNGYASQLSTIPVNGRNPPTSLEEAAVHMTINADGSLSIVDFFMPWEKTQLDGADKDLGTSPLELLPSEFSCGDVKRIGVVTGKSGKTYWLNLDDLGGYQNGPNKLDDVIQVYQNENSVYAGAGVYPLEGGYIYISVIGYPTHVFKFSCSAGVPSFAKVADTPSANAGILGVGHGTTTSLNGQAGTGLLWTSDVRGQSLRIYKAVPENGLLTQINGFNVDSVTKFTRPVFGDGRVYIGTTKGFLYGFGSPVNLPINCTSPVDFGTANLNTPTASKTITCKANVGVTISNVSYVGDSNFVVSGLPTVPSTYAAGATFTMTAVFNPKAVGILSQDILITTSNGVAGYSTSTPITLRGTGQSVDALLRISPVTLAFEGVIAGGQVGGVNQSAIFTNLGNAALSISDIQYSIVGETGPFVAPNGTAANPKAGPFTFYGLPSTIPGNSGVTVNINFDSSVTGNYGAYLKVVSNGGTKFFDVVGTAGSAPKALIEFQTVDGLGWVTFDPAKNFTFGNVTENQTRSLKMRVTNNGTSESTKLYLTVSKPPFGVAGIIGANNQVDLAEGTSLAPGESATATLYCSVPKTQWNQDPYYGAAHWTMNLDDPAFGKHDIGFDCTAVTEQAPPLLSNGLGLYKYTGCFKENNPGRQLQTQLTASDTMTNAICIAACNAAGVVFCGTQYNRECWGGPKIPTLEVDDGNCDYPCKGDINQICGGNGVGDGAGGSYISLFADSSRFDGNTTTPGSSTTTTPSTPAPTGGPFVNPGVGGYSSIGCYTESTTGRALPNGKTIASKTVALCVAACSASNYIYAGVEYGGECWCGNAFTAGSVPTAITDCNMVCGGNATEYCGAGSRLNVYQKGAVISSSSRPVTVSSSSTAISSSVSVSSSASTTSGVSSSTSTSGGVSSSSSVATSGSTSASSTRSSSILSSSTSSVVSSSTSSSSSSTPSPTGPAVRQTVGKYNFQGCWTESTTGRALSSKTYADDGMTLESCASFCSAFSMFGVEYGRECYCGNSLSAGSVKATNQADCSFLCPGDKTTYCGAGSRLQLYSVSASSSSSTASSTSSVVSSSSSAPVTASSSSVRSSSATSASSIATSSSASSSVSIITSLPPVSTTTSTSPIPTTSKAPSGPAIVPSVGLYNYAGCYTEGTNVRALSGALYANDSLTIQTCAQACSAYTYFGAEYGRECWCGNSFGAGSTLVTDKDCTKVCGGDSTQYCGNGNRLSVYIKNGTAGGTGSNGSSRPSSSSSSSVIVSTSSSSSSVQSTSSTVRSSTSSAVSVSSPSPTSSSSVRSSSSSSVASSSSTTSSKAATYTGPPVTSQGNVNFTYYSCVSEPSSGRLLPSQLENNATAMTISKCLSKCWNYQYAGVEYGQECWCGNSLNTAGNAGATPSANLTDSKCNFKCPGNSSEFCGAGGALNLYWFDLEKAVRNAGGS